MRCNKNLIYVFPEMKLRSLVRSPYTHAFVSDLYIPNWSACLAAVKYRWTDPGNICSTTSPRQNLFCSTLFLFLAPERVLRAFSSNFFYIRELSPNLRNRSFRQIRSYWRFFPIKSRDSVPLSFTRHTLGGGGGYRRNWCARKFFDEFELIGEFWLVTADNE